ncbi:MAG: hypothetical protein HZB26_15185 [Candidatus Hydrogenedentes bacterium]|nr:hypothetical protein [Candidatus Hydrogenedentota bacterium]
MVRAGRLWVGPWYVLPDEFLVSPESLVRNLMLGHSISAEFGHTMKVGYVPDPFGHVAQLPQILNGFDLDTFLFARGLDVQEKDVKLEFEWSGLDGSRVLACNQRFFYNNAAFLGYRIVWGDSENLVQDRALAIKRIGEACASLEKHTRCRTLLLNNGVDHSEHQPELPKLLAQAAREFPQYRFKIASFEEYINTVKRELSGAKLQRLEGELSYHYGEMLHGVYSTRMYLKTRNQHCQDLLEANAEPLAALAWATKNGEYPQDTLWHAWRELLKNHPHDDISGCSMDAVHRENEHRYNQVETVGAVLSRVALRAIAQDLDNSRVAGVPVMVFNPAGARRTEVMTIDIDLKREGEAWKSFTLFDERGREVPYDLVRSEEIFRMEPLKGFELRRHTVRVRLDLPPVGYRTLYVREGKPAAVRPIVKVMDRRFENDHYTLAIQSNGSLDLRDKATKKTYPGLLIFEDSEDCGDEYNWSYLPSKPEPLTTAKSKARLKRIHSGPLSATWRIAHVLNVPESLTPDRQARAKKRVALDIVSEVTCYAGSPRIDVVTRVNNIAKDHRLRALFPTTLKTDTVQVDGHFAVVERSVIQPPVRGNQPPYPTRHQRRFASLREGKRGFAIINDGLPEFEVICRGGRRTLAQTLFRAVGWLCRSDLSTRPFYVGPPLPTPEAQCFRAMEFRYAFMAHRGDCGPVMREALSHNLGVCVTRCDVHSGTEVKQLEMFQDPFMREQPMRPVPHEGRLPDHGSFIDFGNEGLVLSALKKCETRNTLIVRVYNPGATPIKTTLTAFRAIEKAYLTNLNEKREKPLRVVKGAVPFTCPAYKVLTFELQLEK